MLAHKLQTVNVQAPMPRSTDHLSPILLVALLPWIPEMVGLATPTLVKLRLLATHLI